jgi:hypothetical protein
VIREGGSSGAAKRLSSNLPRQKRGKSPPAFALSDSNGRAELDDHMKHRDGAFSLAGEIERKQMANIDDSGKT